MSGEPAALECASAPETSVIRSFVIHGIVATKLFSRVCGRSFVYCSERRSFLENVRLLEALGVKFITITILLAVL